MAFPYTFDVIPGYTASISLQGGFRAVRRFRVAYANHIGFMSAIIGTQFPGYSAVRCTGCDVEPQTDLISGDVEDPSTDLEVYDSVFVSAVYESLQAEESSGDGTLFTYRQSLSAEFLTVPSRALRWSDNDKPVSPDAHGAILIPKTEHNITWHKVASPNWSVLSGLRGKVNSGSISIPVIGLSCPTETLLFEGADTSIQVAADGSGLWQVTVKLTEKKINGLGGSAYGWNHAYRDNPAGWVRPKNSSGDYNYATADFSSLFVQA